MLDFKDVVFQFPVEEKPIIDHLSFHVDRGEFISIIGASGCGKSTIFRLINRLLVPEKGEILVAGRRVAGKPAADSGKEKSPEKPRDKTRGNIPVCGYMPQQDLLFPWRTVEENICLPMELQGGISREEQHRRAQKALKDVGLAGKGDKRPSELSGGMRQRAAFANPYRDAGMASGAVGEGAENSPFYHPRCRRSDLSVRPCTCRGEESYYFPDFRGDSARCAPVDRRPEKT